MNNNSIKKTRFFPVWAEEKEIKWLGDMSAQGWHLKKRGFLSYWFNKGEEKEYVYKYDFKLSTAKDYDEYRQIFEDSGWEHIDEFANWHYFRCEKGSGAKDIYTDTESERQRLRRLLILMASLAGINLVIVFNNFSLLNYVTDNFRDIPFYLFLIWGFSLFVVALLGYAAVRILIKMQKLKKNLVE